MHKTGKKNRFLIFMAIYVAVMLIIMAVGLFIFWNVIAAYEASRPLNTVDAYMASLTPEHIGSLSGELIGQVDHNIQSEEECLQIISDAVSGGLTYAKKTSECTETEQVYVLRSGSQVVGNITIRITQYDKYGFPRWELASESFDMSYLIGESYRVTVPEEFPVYVNGVLLDESYIVEQDLTYSLISDFYDHYELPVMVTYEAPAVLGNPERLVTDPDGNPVDMAAVEDYDIFLDNCRDSEIATLDTFVTAFVGRYVTFTSGANGAVQDNYLRMMEYVVPGSHLAERMALALDGLNYAQSRGDKITSITVNHYINIGGGRYICDITYLVDTTGRAGVVQVTNNIQILIVETEDGLKVEAMTSY